MIPSPAITKPRSSSRVVPHRELPARSASDTACFSRRRTLLTPETATGRHAAIALPAEGRRVRDVRHFTAAVLSQWAIADDDADSVLLVVGELAANSAMHGHAELEVLLSLHGHVLDIEVVDSGSVRGHRPSRSNDDGEYGRGLDIVAALADEWQTCQSASGWQACARIRVTPQPLACSLRATPEGT
ncbi:ATP-binding protein [Streptomyces sp. NPDC006385]|uniref:ATP-binding protein n=1 Tax=Streptomyces sp. NPDC006385 TaxID=3156761 RepID=UPI0033B65CB5